MQETVPLAVYDSFRVLMSETRFILPHLNYRTLTPSYRTTLKKRLRFELLIFPTTLIFCGLSIRLLPQVLWNQSSGESHSLRQIPPNPSWQGRNRPAT